MKKIKKNIGLEINTYPKNRRWMLDFDYDKELDDEARAWLNQFYTEYYRGRFDKDVDHLHKTTEQKRECYNRNYRNNVDTAAIKDCSGLLVGDNTIVNNEGEASSAINFIADPASLNNLAMVNYIHNKRIAIKKEEEKNKKYKKA